MTYNKFYSDNVSYISGSQCASQALGGLAKTQIFGPISPGWDPRMCITSKFAGDALMLRSPYFESHCPTSKCFMKTDNISDYY